MTEQLRSSSSITLATAMTALQAGLARADELQVRVNIAVTDPAGGLLAFARMDRAFAASGQIAQDKAWTVAAFEGVPSDELYAALAGEDAVREGIAQRGRVAAFAGGVPIRVHGELVGAVGVSGASAHEDKAVASAAAAAVDAAAN